MYTCIVDHGSDFSWQLGMNNTNYSYANKAQESKGNLWKEPHHAKELPYIKVHIVQCHNPASHRFLIFPDVHTTTETNEKKEKNMFKQKVLASL